MLEISIDDLTPDTVAKKTLVAFEGSILVRQGEKLLSVHIDLLRKAGLERVFAIDTAKEATQVRRLHNVTEIDPQDAKPHHVLARRAATPEGKAVFSSGQRCDERTVQVLVENGVQSILVSNGTASSPAVLKFLSEMKDYDQRRSFDAETIRKRLENNVAEVFLTAWMHICKRLAGVEFERKTAEFRPTIFEDGFYAWTIPYTANIPDRGDLRSYVVLSLDERSAFGLASATFGVAEEEPSEESLTKLFTMLITAFMEEILRRAPRMGVHINLENAVRVCSSVICVRILEGVSIGFRLTSSVADVQLSFGSEEPIAPATSVPKGGSPMPTPIH